MSFITKSTIIALIIGALLGSLAFGVLWRPVRYVDLSTLAGPPAGTDCTVSEEELTVQGTSMGNLLPEGSRVKAQRNYYACKSAESDDIVLYDYPGSSIPLAKRVVGVPGDKFGLREAASGQWNLLVNGEVAKTSKGEPYVISGNGYRMLNLYVKDYEGVIPQDAYLILGDLPGGSLDSTEFGLVGRDSFVGKIEK